MRTVFIIGVPGSGKTTVVNEALRLLDLQPVVEHITPIPHVRHGTLWHLGRERDNFGGTDALAMNINPKAIAWVQAMAAADGAYLNAHYAEKWGDDPQPYLDRDNIDTPLVLLGEGDRLANAAFFAACPNLTVVWLDTPLPEARARASIRARALGVPEQGESWWKGRATKVSNLANSRPVRRLDGSRTASESAADLAELLAAP